MTGSQASASARLEPGVDGGQARLVAEEHPHGHVGFSGPGELWPDVSHPDVEVEFATLGQDVGAHGGGALGGREHELQGPVVVGPSGLTVVPAAVQVQHRTPVAVDADLRAQVPELGEVGDERVEHPGEGGIDSPRDHPVWSDAQVYRLHPPSSSAAG